MLVKNELFPLRFLCYVFSVVFCGHLVAEESKGFPARLRSMACTTESTEYDMLALIRSTDSVEDIVAAILRAFADPAIEMEKRRVLARMVQGMLVPEGRFDKVLVFEYVGLEEDVAEQKFDDVLVRLRQSVSESKLTRDLAGWIIVKRSIRRPTLREFAMNERLPESESARHAFGLDYLAARIASLKSRGIRAKEKVYVGSNDEAIKLRDALQERGVGDDDVEILIGGK